MQRTDSDSNQAAHHANNEEELHAQAVQHINDANQLLFKDLPQIIEQIIAEEVWDTRPINFKNFAEYALYSAPIGLGIANNKMLWLLKSTLNKKPEYAPRWAEVIEEVDNSVRQYAKEKKIPMKEFKGDLVEEPYDNPELSEAQTITYLPSRSNSDDGRLLKLKSKDPQAYEDVMQNKVKLKEAWPQTPKKKIEPIESVKSKFSSLSKADREAFLAWLEEEKILSQT